MRSDEGTEERCGFVLEPGDVSGDAVDDYEGGSDEWYEDSAAACCWREVWDGGHGDLCIWHAETEEKAVEELLEARTDGRELLDGAYVPAVELGDAADFEECRLQAVTFDGTDLQRTSFQNAILGAAEFPNANLAAADFSEAYLWRAQFQNADLREAQLENADLREAWLPCADLQNTEFTGTDLRNAEFPGADLRNAEFTGGDLRNTEFPGAELRNTEFPHADLQGAQFSHAYHRRAQFPHANLRDGQFSDAGLWEAQFRDATLRRAQFPDADLRRVQFPDADLHDTTFTSANLEHVDLTGTDLFDADLQGTDLYGTSFEDVSINRGTTFGAHYVPAPPRGVLARLARVRTVGRELLLAIAPGRADSDDEDRLGKAAWTYRTVERLSEDAGLSKQARSFNVQRKDIERRLYLAEDGSRWRWAMAMLSSLSMRYGQRPWRVVGISVATVFAGALLYPLWGLRAGKAGEPVTTIGYPFDSVGVVTGLGKSLYFSVITFTTLGYGDVQPLGFGEALATVESFLGALLMALLVYVLGRRATW